MQVRIVLHNIRSTYNVGAILRTAEEFGVEQVVLSGYTPRWHDPQLLPHLREKIDRAIEKTALGAENLIDIYSSHDIMNDLRQWKEGGWQIIGLENNISKTQQKPKIFTLNNPKLRLRERVVLILGEEVGGIDYLLHDIIDLFIEIPMCGKKESFNVSVATGIALYGLNYRPKYML